MSESTPVVVPAAQPPIPLAVPVKKGKGPMVVVVIVLLLLCCCVTVIVGGYLFLRVAQITLNGQCYEGLQKLMDGKPGCNVPVTTGNDTKPTDTTKPVDNTTPTPTPVSPTTKTYSTGEYSFTYPITWKLETDSDDATVTTPEDDTVAFPLTMVPENVTLTSSNCKDFANEYLASAQEVDPAASLVTSKVEAIGSYNGCVFDIDYTKSGTLFHTRFSYVVEGTKALMIRMRASDASTMMVDMLKVVYSLKLK